MDLAELLLDRFLVFYAVSVACVRAQIPASIHHEVEVVSFGNFASQAVPQRDVVAFHVWTFHALQLLLVVLAALRDKWHAVAVDGFVGPGLFLV